MTPKAVERYKKTLDTIPLDDLEMEQIQKKDNYTYFSPYYPLFSGFDVGINVKPLSKMGLGIGHSRNNFFSVDASFIYNAFISKPNYIETDKLRQCTLYFRTSTPVFRFRNSKAEKPILFHTNFKTKTSYLIFPKIEWTNSLNLNIGFENEYNKNKWNNSTILKNYQIDISDGLDYSQINQIARFGVSYLRKSNFKCKITLEGTAYYYKKVISHELFFDFRYGIDGKIAEIDYYNSFYIPVFLGHIKPSDYIPYKPFGFETGYRIHLGDGVKTLLNIDVNACIRSGYFDFLSDRFYIRIRLGMGFGIFRPKKYFQ